jgi:hypothetical protein
VKTLPYKPRFRDHQRALQPKRRSYEHGTSDDLVSLLASAEVAATLRPMATHGGARVTRAGRKDRQRRDRPHARPVRLGWKPAPPPAVVGASAAKTACAWPPYGCAARSPHPPGRNQSVAAGAQTAYRRKGLRRGYEAILKRLWKARFRGGSRRLYETQGGRCARARHHDPR